MRWWLTPVHLCLLPLILLSAFAGAYGQKAGVEEAFRQGAAAMKSGNSEQAEKAFREAVRLDPSMPEAHLDLGLVLGRAGKIDEAVASIRQALQLNPGLPSGHMFLGIFLYQGNHPEEALKELEIELAADPKNAEALTWAGTINLASGHPERAVQDFDRAVEQRPDDLNLLEFRGRAHNLVARDSYSRMAKIDPGNWHVHRVQAELYADEGKHADAIREYQAAIQLEQRNPDLYESLGDEYRALSQLEPAEEAYRKGLTLGPANPVAQYNLGSVEVERNKSAEGVPLLQQMIHTYPGSPVVEYYLGRGLADLDQDEEAAQWLRKSAEGDHDGEVAKRSWYSLSRLYRKLHRAGDADQALAQYHRINDAMEKASHAQMLDWKKLGQPAPSDAPQN